MKTTLSGKGERTALLDVLVIGGGQAGLALGYHLRHTARRFLIVNAAPEVGYARRTRYDSWLLFTPAKRDALPGLPFPGDPDHDPSKEEVANDLTEYVRTFHEVQKPGTALHRPFLHVWTPAVWEVLSGVLSRRQRSR